MNIKVFALGGLNEVGKNCYIIEKNKDLIIIALIVLSIYFFYQQSQKTLPIQPNSQELQELRNQANHYQTLYQKRVEKDIGGADQNKYNELASEFSQFKALASQKQAQLTTTYQTSQTLFQTKLSNLESQLLNLARQKIKGKKEAQVLLNNLETNFSQQKTE